MGSIAYEEYMTIFFKLFRYVLYFKDEKAKVHKFFSGLPLAFKDQIDYDEHWSLEEVIGKLKHYFEQSNRKTKRHQGWKEKDKTKGKWPSKQIRPQDVGEKKNFVPYKKFNVLGKGHESKPRGKKNKSESKG